MYRIAYFAPVLLLLGVLIVAQPASAQTTSLTAEQRADLEYFGFPTNLTNGDELLKDLYGGCTYNPYRVLEQKYKGSQNVQLTPHNSSGSNVIAGIDPVLACRLTKFFDVAAEKGCRPKISSAYRSPQQQANMCGPVGGTGCLAAGKSCHQYGLAVDVSTSCIGWMRMAAPQFQLVFPYSGEHIQCREHPRANRDSCSRPCNGSIPISPDLSRLPDPSKVPNTYFVLPPGGSPIGDEPLPPNSNFLNRSSVGYLNTLPTQNPTASQPTPSPQSSQQSEPKICSPSFSCTGGTMYYQTTSCTTQVYQICAYGCDGNSCKTASSTTSGLGSSISDLLSGVEVGTSTSNSNGSGDSASSSKPSVFDILNSIVNPVSFSSTEVGTSVPLVLNADTRNLGGIGPDGLPRSEFSQETITSVQPINSQSTFTSNDLGTSFVSYTPQQPSTIQVALANMKAALLQAIDFLRRLGGQ